MKIAEIKSLELTILQKNYSFQHIQLVNLYNWLIFKQVLK